MSKEQGRFEKEDRYLVVKRSDIQRVLLNWEKDELYRLAEMVGKGRENLNKASLECVVVESDWPIYDDVWKMVEAIAKGEPTELEQLRKERDELIQMLEKFLPYSRTDIDGEKELLGGEFSYNEGSEGLGDEVAALLAKLNQQGGE